MFKLLKGIVEITSRTHQEYIQFLQLLNEMLDEGLA